MRGIKSGAKVTITLPNGLRWPGVAVSDETVEKRTVMNKATPPQPVEIEVTRFDVISKRETLAGETWYGLSSEVGQYGYRPVAELRDTSIVGLDADENGEVITQQALREIQGVSRSAFQAAQFALRNGSTDAASL